MTEESSETDDGTRARENAVETAILGRESASWDVEVEVALAQVSRSLTGPAAPSLMIGRYVVIERLGAGAMGVVLRAYDPKLHREVALKIVRPGASFDEMEARARLLREAQALARLSHPNVVAVYDAEATEHGVCIAMEYVEGRTLRLWLKERKRAWPEVVQVVLAIAHGLAAAHATGLVHRDVKPDNVLIGDAKDGRSAGRVRVTDFGLARARSDATPPNEHVGSSEIDRGAAEMLTRTGTLVGTPAYMAPEQHLGATPDARADQYALCVVLWEALYGERPFRADDFEGIGRAKRRGPPPRPSTRVPAWLHGVLARGLAVKPEQRWPSCDALADALAGGQARVARRRAVAGVAALAIVGAGGLVWRDRDRAQREETCVRDGASIEEVWSDDARATIRASLVATGVAYAEATHDRLVPWVDRWTAAWSTARTQVCHEALEGTRSPDLYARSLACLQERREELEGLLDALGHADATTVQRAVSAVASLSGVEPCSETAALERRPVLPADPQTREAIETARRELMRVRGSASTGRYKEDLARAETLLASATELDHGPLVEQVRLQVGQLASKAGDLARAEEVLRRAFVEAGARGDDEVAAMAAIELVYVIGYSGRRFAEGLAWADPADMLVRRLGQDEGPLGGSLINNRAVVYYAHGDDTRAIELHKEAIAIRERLFGDDHPELAVSYNNLANAYADIGDREAAESLHLRALAIHESTFGPDHPSVAISLNNLGNIHRDRERYDEARAMYERALAIRERALGPDSMYVAHSIANLGLLAHNMQDEDRAQELYERALVLLEARLGPEHVDLAATLNNLANVHLARREYAAAQALYERTLAIREKGLGPEHPLVGQVLTSLGYTALNLRDLAAAQRWYARALAVREKAFGPDDHIVAESLTSLAKTRTLQGEYDEARALLARALAVAEKADGETSVDVAYPLVGLGEVALATKRPLDALAPLERAVAVSQTASDETTIRARARLALARALWDAPAGRGRDRQRAHALATESAAAWRKRGDDPGALDEVDAWLATHPRPR